MLIAISGQSHTMLSPAIEDGDTRAPDRAVRCGKGHRHVWDNATRQEAQHILAELRYFGEGTVGWDGDYHDCIRACARDADRIQAELAESTS